MGEATPSDSGKKRILLYISFSSTFLHREAGAYLFSSLSQLFYFNYSISLSIRYYFLLLYKLIRRLKNSTWLNNDGMAKTNMIQAASVFSPDTMSSVIPSFPRFSIRGLYLCLFLSCLVIPNNSRKPNVTSFLYSFPCIIAFCILSSLPASNTISSFMFFLMFRLSSLILQSSCLIGFLSSILFLLK